MFRVPDDYEFDAETVDSKRIDLKYVFGISVSRATNYKIHVLYEMQYVIHRMDLPDGMKEWLIGLTRSLDLDNKETAELLKNALTSARQNSEGSHISHEDYS